MKTLRNLREAKEDYKLAPQVAELTEAFDETDEVGNTLVALNHLASIADDLYSVIGAGDVNVTPDEIDSILSAYDILAEIHDKYDDAFPMPSQDYDLDALDVEVTEEIALQLEELELAEGLAWKITVKTLTDLGFKEMNPEGKQPFMVPKKKISHIWGKNPLYFVILMDEDAGNKPYVIVDSEDGSRTAYTDLNRAFADLKKMVKDLKEEVELEELALTELTGQDNVLSHGVSAKAQSILKDLGFKETTPGPNTWQNPTLRVNKIWGIPMRAGKWADIFFASLNYDHMRFAIIDDSGIDRFESLDKAISSLKTKAKMAEMTESVLDEAPITKTKWKVAFSYDDPSGVGIANAKITVHANDSESAKRFAETDLKKKGRFKNFRIKSASKINEESELEDVELTETPGGPSIVQKLKATRAGFQAKLDSGKYPDSEDSFKKMIAKLDTQLKAHSVKKEDVDQLDEVKVTITKWNLNKGVEGQFRMEVIGQDGSAAAKILDKVMPSAKFALFDDQFGFKTTKERDAASAALVKFYSAIKEWDTTEIPLGTISEEFDETKFRRLAMTGLVPDTDVALIIRAMKTLDAGKVLTVQQKNLIATTFQSLIGLVTGDTSVFSKIQTAVKKGATDAK
jgi:hypothetical protein